MHKAWEGKIEVISRVPLKTKDDLSIAYTPGVAEPCLKISEDPSLSYVYTRRHNLVCRCDGWNCGSWSWRHRPGGGYACCGRKMRPV